MQSLLFMSMCANDALWKKRHSRSYFGKRSETESFIVSYKCNTDPCLRHPIGTAPKYAMGGTPPGRPAGFAADGCCREDESTAR